MSYLFPYKAMILSLVNFAAASTELGVGLKKSASSFDSELRSSDAFSETKIGLLTGIIVFERLSNMFISGLP
jgi:hypothetical protein